MVRTGERVQHRNTRRSFGFGEVLAVNAAQGTALVQWETHGVKRVGKTLTRQQSHVNLASLTRAR